MDKALLLFDGVCVLCQKSVAWLIRKDHKGLIQFSSLQGETAKTYLSSDELKAMSSLVLIYQQKHYHKSTAFLKLMLLLNWPYKGLYVFMLVPKFIRDAVYVFIAKNRYKWFGKHTVCWLPDAADKWRFLE
jgi:predicted DCC family thiol-disulfide oxidoreductase YuxK